MKVAILLYIVAIFSSNACPAQDRSSAQTQEREAAQHSNWTPLMAQTTQEQGYWIDPSTGLMWAAKDSEKRMSWHKAVKYCRNLRSAGYSDWRLATIDELESLVNLRAYAIEHVGSSDIFHWNTDLHVNGGLLLAGDRHWSSTQVSDPDMQVSKTHFWSFDFREGKRMSGFEDWAEGDTMHALCVRNAQQTLPSKSY